MRIAILGANGQLGGELQHRLGAEAVAYAHQALDIADPAQIEAFLSPNLPDAVVNCAAYNAVELAESQPDAAFRVNALGPGALAKFCDGRQIPLVHISTDYVFGLDAERNTPYRETDLPGPLGVYAVTKLAGEELVRAGCSRHFLLRTCGLYGRRGRSGKRNFVETMLDLGGKKSELRIISDQRCTPTSTLDLAEAIAGFLSTSAYGTYHATNAGDCSWAEFAAEIFRLAKMPVKVIPIPSSEYAAKVRRPAYSVLNCSKLADVLGKPLRPWQAALAEYLSSQGPAR